ncbi:MAG: hypothetical protein JO224_13310 [Pelomonas sp.]|nr:hypothetical protein [Roseateles sp.]
MHGLRESTTTGMWRVVFYERTGFRIEINRKGPWLPSRQLAVQWATWFNQHGQHVALEDQGGVLEKFNQGLPT